MDAKTLSTLCFANEQTVRNASTGTNVAIVASGWLVANGWGTGTIPTSAGRACTAATAGALPLPSSAPHNGVGYVLARSRIEALSQASFLWMVDRCVDYGGLVGNITSAQTLGAMALTRYTTGVGVLPFVETYTTGASSIASTLTISYTNQAGTAGRTGTISMPASWCTSGRVYPILLEAGDTGVRSVQSVTLGSASPNPGDFGIVLLRPISWVATPVVPTATASGYTPTRDITSLGFNYAAANACLHFYVLASATSMPACNITYALV